jgi:hypothetical protein
MMKKLFFVLVVALFLFGCTAPIATLDDSVVLEEFKSIRADYGMENGFTPDQQAMNAYLNKLSGFRGAVGSGGAGDVVKAEIETATTFYYLTKALSESGSLDFYNVNCNDIKLKNTVSYADATIESASDADTTISSLSENALKNLRDNQLETVREYKTTAEQIKIAINEIC